MDETDVLRAGADEVRRLVRDLAPEDLARPTPCPDWDVRALLAHVVTGQEGLVAVLRGEQPDWSRDALGDDPAAAVEQALDGVLEAWRQPGAVETPSQQLPGMRVVDFALADALAHAWDLGAALGRPPAFPDDVVRLAWERWSGGAAETGRTYGAFGPAVEVPGDRPLQDRLLGLFGRDPDWRPPR